MDMFSQFFVSPLMMKEAMQREREAIESGILYQIYKKFSNQFDNKLYTISKDFNF